MSNNKTTLLTAVHNSKMKPISRRDTLKRIAGSVAFVALGGISQAAASSTGANTNGLAGRASGEVRLRFLKHGYKQHQGKKRGLVNGQN